MQHCDVLIIGGGPAGLATAVHLRRRAELDVVVIEATAEPAERYGETLPPGALLALDGLGVLSSFRAAAHVPCPGTLTRWGADRDGHNDFILDPFGPAWHLDRAAFEAMLRARALELGMRLRARARAVDIVRRASGFETQLRHADGGSETIASRWVVDATGRSAWAARRLGASRRRFDALTAIVRIADIAAGSVGARTLVESTAIGWWYAAPLPRSRHATVLITDRVSAGSFVRDGAAGWRAQLADTRLVSPGIAGCRLARERIRVQPVAIAALDEAAGPGWLAVGDAACELDPMGGRGIHDGLDDGLAAAQSILAALGVARPNEPRYAARIRARFAEHLAIRAAHYARETRWPTAPFWARRSMARPTVLGASSRRSLS